jgi:transposase InsO family protein
MFERRLRDKGGKVQTEQMLSGLHLKADVPRTTVGRVKPAAAPAMVRLECLGRHWFLDLDDAREKIEEWQTEYNEVRPDSTIGDKAPMSSIYRPQQHAAAANRPEILT